MNQYETTYEDIAKLKDFITLDKWFRINIKPFKAIAMSLIKKWSNMFKEHLLDDVTNNLKELDIFIKDKIRELTTEVGEGDITHLVNMMACLGDIREKTAYYDNMFEPIRKKIDLLKTYGQECPDFVYEKLQVT